ncbi:hypothetical protein GMLC_10790 [Geomonas limicola]|uniref:Integrase n=1 Tax=Geomonas limicola TaxID=2740186 RepID=A0A6V8N542_9BACT|nr:hypothetical protein [Geomonas limicola]GFO67500.1 hypothetical protein GMLC_10790 [Geomonas limicola]
MPNVINFTAKGHENPDKNLADFIHHAITELTLYDWHKDKWTTTKGAKDGTLVFAKLGATAYKWERFDQPFMDFAKAYIREVETLNQVTSRALDVMALRYLFYSLEQVTGTCDVTRVSGEVIIEAANHIDIREDNKTRQYQIGGKLEKIFDFLRSTAFICPDLPGFVAKERWKKQADKAQRTDEEGKKHREERLPSDHVMKQFIYAFRLAETPMDRYWASVGMLLLFAPNRGGEFHFLSINSLGWEEYQDEDGVIKKKMYLRWFSEKGADHNKKWVFSWFEEAVQQAFDILVEISAPARDAARFAFNYPGKYMIHEGCVTPVNHPQNVPLTDVELANAIHATSLLNRRGYTINASDRKTFPAYLKPFLDSNPSYSQLAEATLPQYKSRDWPKFRHQCSFPVWENLLLMRENEFHANFPPKPFSWRLPDTNEINRQLGGKQYDTRTYAPTLFERLNLTDEHGGKIEIESHDLRRWHNTRAMQEGATELQIAWHSGRKDMSQNRAYDLRTPEQIAERLYEVTVRPKLQMVTRDDIPLHERIQMNLPVHRSDLIKEEVGHQTVHIGAMGGCVKHVTEPDCLKGRQCHGCSKHIIVKGVPGCLDYFIEEERRLQFQWDALQDHRDDPYMQRTVMNVGMDLGFVRGRRRILESSNVPDGTPIQIPRDFDPSEIRLGLMEQGLQQASKPEPDVMTLDIALLLPGVFKDA